MVDLCALRGRYAHQLVYDRVNKAHYLFGGNPNVKNVKDQSAEHVRLGDFWQLQLARPEESTLIKRCLCLLRRQRFIEMCQTDPRQALRYLQSDLHSVVNHQDAEESTAFRALSKSLFGGAGKSLSPPATQLLRCLPRQATLSHAKPRQRWRKLRVPRSPQTVLQHRAPRSMPVRNFSPFGVL